MVVLIRLKWLHKHKRLKHLFIHVLNTEPFSLFLLIVFVLRHTVFTVLIQAHYTHQPCSEQQQAVTFSNNNKKKKLWSSFGWRKNNCSCSGTGQRTVYAGIQSMPLFGIPSDVHLSVVFCEMIVFPWMVNAYHSGPILNDWMEEGILKIHNFVGQHWLQNLHLLTG